MLDEYEVDFDLGGFPTYYVKAKNKLEAKRKAFKMLQREELKLKHFVVSIKKWEGK